MKIRLWLFLFASLLQSVPALAQSVYSVAGFEPDQFARTTERRDANGSYMALVKVVSSDPDDDLRRYEFNFGNMRHDVDTRNHDDGLWVFVQRNARQVVIKRDNNTFSYDIQPAIEAGRVYYMHIKAPVRVVQKQWVQFEVTPAAASVRVTGSDKRERDLGIPDADGKLAVSLEYGTYTYTVSARGYQPTEGRFTLPDRDSDKHIERVQLSSNLATITLRVNAEADIYIDGEKRDRRTWSGRLEPGSYQVECRMDGHRTTSRVITVTAGNDRSIDLDVPVPITGKIEVNSRPLGATIKVDGHDHGTTPATLNVKIGSHSVEIAKDNYRPYTQTVEVRENQTVPIEATLVSMASQIIPNQQSDKDKDKPRDKPKQSDKPKTVVPRQFFKPTGGYVQAGFQVGGQMGPAVSLGTYIHNVNIEAFGCYAVNSETLYGISFDGSNPVENNVSPLIMGVKLGYGFAVRRRLRFTPQLGFGVATVKGDIASFYASFVSVGVRSECAVHPRVSLFLDPQLRFAVKRSSVFESIAEQSSRVRNWGGGFDALLGISINF